MISIIDYGMGNLMSVFNAFTALGFNARISDKPSALREASGIVLPGVGSFPDGMRNLIERAFIEELEKEVIKGGKPFLGLCLGLQLLGTRGFEHGETAGLNWIPGVVDRLPLHGTYRVPHIGWNDVRITKPGTLFAGLGESVAFYFVHSFVLIPNDKNAISGLTHYGVDFVASVQRDNICATQFHPEKSHKTGLAVLQNWGNALSKPC